MSDGSGGSQSNEETYNVFSGSINARVNFLVQPTWLFSVSQGLLQKQHDQQFEIGGNCQTIL